MSVSITNEPSVNYAALAEILGSSATVAERIQAYKDAKTQADQALAQLKIGQDAKAAYDDANAKQAEAAAVLEKAKADADAGLARLSEASAKAAEIIKDANDEKEKILAEIALAKKNHDTWIENSTADLKERQKQLDDALQSVANDKAATLATQKQAEEDSAAAKAAQAAAEAAEARFRAGAEKLQGALMSISGGGV